MKRSFPALVAAMVVSITPAAAQTTHVPVEVVDESEGSVGQRLVYMIKEEFRKSSGFSLGGDSGSRIQLIVSTMPKEKDSPDVATIYSAIWNFVLYDVQTKHYLTFYWSNTLGYSGTNVIGSEAQTLVAKTDALAPVFLKVRR